MGKGGWGKGGGVWGVGWLHEDDSVPCCKKKIHSSHLLMLTRISRSYIISCSILQELDDAGQAISLLYSKPAGVVLCKA